MSELTQTVFIVDDDPAFLKSLSRLLRASGYTVQSFSSAEEFMAQRPASAVGCVVADLQMPTMDGIALQRELTQSDNPLPIVFLTGHGDIPASVQAMRQGAEDFLVKTAGKEDLLSAIERAFNRNQKERSTLQRQKDLEKRFANLTPRENEVLAHVLCGKLNKQIAADLGIDERSVKRHRTSIMAKLDVKSVVALTQLVEEVGIRSTLQQQIDAPT